MSIRIQSIEHRSESIWKYIMCTNICTMRDTLYGVMQQPIWRTDGKITQRTGASHATLFLFAVNNFWRDSPPITASCWKRAHTCTNRYYLRNAFLFFILELFENVYQVYFYLINIYQIKIIYLYTVNRRFPAKSWCLTLVLDLHQIQNHHRSIHKKSSNCELINMLKKI